MARELSSDDSEREKIILGKVHRIREGEELPAQVTCLTCTALFRLLSGHLHKGVQHQSVVQPRVPVLQLLQEVGACGLRHLSSGELTQPLDEPRDVQQGYFRKKNIR